MGKRKKKKSAPLTWKAIRGATRLLSKGILKTSPLLFIGAVGAFIFWGIRENLYADPGFLLQRVEVTPAQSLSAQKIKELEKIYLHQNLFKISAREVAERVEQDPEIKEAHVVRDFPKTLRIRVIDRSTFGQIRLLPHGSLYILAGDGVILSGETSRNNELLLVEILNSNLLSLERGKKYPLPGLKEGIALTKAFKSRSLGRSETVEKIQLDHWGDVSVFLKDGPELRFGRDPMKKLQVLDSLIPLLKGEDRKEILYIELQYQDLVVRKK